MADQRADDIPVEGHCKQGHHCKHQVPRQANRELHGYVILNAKCGACGSGVRLYGEY